MSQLASDNEHAFRVLFDEYHQKVYSLAIHLTRSESIAEDIVQDVFLKIWQNRSNLDKIEYFKAYLKVAARNTSLNYLRKIAREKLAMEGLVLSDITSVKGSTTDPERSIIEKQYGQILEQAIGSLPPRQAQIYRMSRIMGMKNGEIALELGISIHTVKEHLKIAMKRIFASLENQIELVIAAAIAIYF